MGTCFVAMPISVPDEYLEFYSDREMHFSHVFSHLFSPALTQCGYEVIPPVVSGSDVIHAEIIRNLEQADLVLCDISCMNPNVFFELGIRTALDRSVVIVKDNFTSRIPFDTGSINSHTYDASLTPWSLETQLPTLVEHVSNSIKKADGRNPLWRYFGLTQQASPAEIADPIEAKLDLILKEITQLRSLPEPARIRETGTRPDPPSALAGSARHRPILSLSEGLRVAYDEGYTFGHQVATEAPVLWLDAVIARKPIMPSDTESRLLQSSGLSIDLLLHDEVRAALREGFFAALEEERKSE